MAKRPKQHKIGQIGETKVKLMFEEAGYACSKTDLDYGEEDSIIEPYRIYVQVKTMKKERTIKSDWTIYDISTQTIKNWVIANDMTITIRYNLYDDKAYYSIPEDDIYYWDIKDSDNNLAIKCEEEFTKKEIEKIIWRARLRHYDRLIRLTMPNHFEDTNWYGIPEYKLFLHEFLKKIDLVDENGRISDELFVRQANMKLYLLQDCEFEDSEDMTAIDKSLYAACSLIILNRLQEYSGVEVGLTPFFTDQCSIVLFQLIKANIKEIISNKAQEEEQG